MGEMMGDRLWAVRDRRKQITILIYYLLPITYYLFLHPSLCYPEAVNTQDTFQYFYGVMDRFDPSGEKPRFLKSYETFSKENDHAGLSDTCFVYDNALVLIAFLARGNPEDNDRARILSDAFVYASSHDRYYRDGRLRNAYSAKALINPTDSTALLPGRYDEHQQQWQEDKAQISTHTGNMAWVMIALCRYYHKNGGKQYLDTALRLGEWIRRETKTDNGFAGGSDGWEPDAQNLTWISVEHNIDIYAAFMMLYRLTNDKKWENSAADAKRFVDNMWDSIAGHFWTGTSKNNTVINTANIPLDIHALAIMALPDRLKYRKALAWGEHHCQTQADGFTGFDFNPDKDGVWFEGTAQMALAYRILGETDKAGVYINQLRSAKTAPKDGMGKGIIAASHNDVTTGFEWQYPRRLHIGATAWYIFAELRCNPFEL